MEVNHLLLVLSHLCLVLRDCLALGGDSVKQEGELLLVLRDECLAGHELGALATDHVHQVSDALFLLNDLSMSCLDEVEQVSDLFLGFLSV